MWHLGGSKPKLRECLRLNRSQTSLLQKSFRTDSRPNKTTLMELALQTDLDIQKIIKWFQNKRLTAKKDKFCEY